MLYNSDFSYLKIFNLLFNKLYKLFCLIIQDIYSENALILKSVLKKNYYFKNFNKYDTY